MAKFYYFNGRGRGEVVRLALAAANIPFTEELISEREHFLKLIEDGKLQFLQVPMLEIDGRQLVQSSSIVRYIGRKAGMCGKNEDEDVLIDQYFEAAKDFLQPALPMVFVDPDTILSKVKSTTLPKYLPIFEKILVSSGTGYLVGDKVSIADVGLLEALLVYDDYLGKTFLNDYPALQKFYATLTSLEGLSTYLAGPQRKPKNSQRYIDEVKRSLSW